REPHSGHGTGASRPSRTAKPGLSSGSGGWIISGPRNVVGRWGSGGRSGGRAPRRDFGRTRSVGSAWVVDRRQTGTVRVAIRLRSCLGLRRPGADHGSFPPCRKLVTELSHRLAMPFFAY